MRTRNAQKRAHQSKASIRLPRCGQGAAGAHACQPGQPAAPQQVHQNRLCLIVGCVGHRHHRLCLAVGGEGGSHRGQKGIAQAAQGCFQIVVARGDFRGCEPAAVEGDAPVAGQFLDKSPIRRGVGAHVVVQVGYMQGQIPLGCEAGQQMEQAYTVGAAAYADNDGQGCVVGLGWEEVVVFLGQQKRAAQILRGGGRGQGGRVGGGRRLCRRNGLEELFVGRHNWSVRIGGWAGVALIRGDGPPERFCA